VRRQSGSRTRLSVVPWLSLSLVREGYHCQQAARLGLVLACFPLIASEFRNFWYPISQTVKHIFLQLAAVFLEYFHLFFVLDLRTVRSRDGNLLLHWFAAWRMFGVERRQVFC